MNLYIQDAPGGPSQCISALGLRPRALVYTILQANCGEGRPTNYAHRTYGRGPAECAQRLNKEPRGFYFIAAPSSVFGWFVVCCLHTLCLSCEVLIFMDTQQDRYAKGTYRCSLAQLLSQRSGCPTTLKRVTPALMTDV